MSLYAIYETPKSREQDIDKFGSTGMREYLYQDTDYPPCMKDAYDAVQDEAPNPEPTFALERRAINLRPLGGPFVLCTVHYVVPEAYEPYDPLGPEFSAEITAGTVHITQSLETRSQTVNTQLDDFTPPDTKLAINVSNKGVGGCDIFSSSCDISFALRRDEMTIEYVQALKQACCTTNSLPYLGYEPGELLYLGGSAQYRGSTGWVVVYRFATASNQTSVTIVPPDDGGAQLVITGTEEDPAKRGWDYLWVGYLEQLAGQGTLQTPAFANVERVYNETDFADVLGWGGPAPLDPPPEPEDPVDPEPEPDDGDIAIDDSDQAPGGGDTLTAVPAGDGDIIDAPTESSVTFTDDPEPPGSVDYSP